MKKLAFILASASSLAMVDPDIEKDGVSQDEYFCNIAMQIYHKKTSLPCSPDLKPYILRTLDYSRHNGDSEKFLSMVKEINEEDEDFMMQQINKAVAAALKDQKQQIEERIPKKDAAFYVGAAGLACTIITTAVTLSATLTGKCPK